ncbi:hypothetical protein ACRALDRAFT_208611 [Sodiomyces alcalophilus JCM 7366]|uniref:uncharacterized protein n=1 Tax=Sodiomyces alcalophilus JCM 7366 TaxID=591952 RepID=UPI0039B5169C
MEWLRVCRWLRRWLCRWRGFKIHQAPISRANERYESGIYLYIVIEDDRTKQSKPRLFNLRLSSTALEKRNQTPTSKQQTAPTDLSPTLRFTVSFFYTRSLLRHYVVVVPNLLVWPISLPSSLHLIHHQHLVFHVARQAPGYFFDYTTNTVIRYRSQLSVFDEQREIPRIAKTIPRAEMQGKDARRWQFASSSPPLANTSLPTNNKRPTTKLGSKKKRDVSQQHPTVVYAVVWLEATTQLDTGHASRVPSQRATARDDHQPHSPVPSHQPTKTYRYGVHQSGSSNGGGCIRERPTCAAFPDATTPFQQRTVGTLRVDWDGQTRPPSGLHVHMTISDPTVWPLEMRELAQSMNWPWASKGALFKATQATRLRSCLFFWGWERDGTTRPYHAGLLKSTCCEVGSNQSLDSTTVRLPQTPYYTHTKLYKARQTLVP